MMESNYVAFQQQCEKKDPILFFSFFRLKKYNSIKVMLPIHKVFKLPFNVEVLKRHILL